MKSVFHFPLGSLVFPIFLIGLVAGIPGSPAADTHRPGAPSAGDEFWDGQFALGVSYSPQPESRAVYAVAVAGENVYVGGDFDHAGHTPAGFIARWNSATRQWSALGAGVNGRVKAIAVQGNDVFVGGNFTAAGGSAAKYIARWNEASQTWSALGGELAHSATPAEVNAIAIGAGGMVYVGGEFETAGGTAVHNIARWTGSAWQALGTGTGGAEHTVQAIAAGVHDIYIGGRFTSVGGTPLSYVARWNGSTWSGLGSGVNNRVDALAVNGNSVYVGGHFTGVYETGSYAPTAAGYVALWNGSTWDTLRGGMKDGYVSALLVGPDGIYAGGQFAGVTNPVIWQLPRNIARWNGSAWLPTPSVSYPSYVGTDGTVFALAYSGAESSVYAGGFMSRTWIYTANAIARWSVVDHTWYGLGDSVNGEVNAIAVNGNDIYLGGSFTSAGGIPAANIVLWNRATRTWSALGSGLSGYTGLQYHSTVQAIDVFDGIVYVGGNFTTAGGISAELMAAWNPSSQTWSGLGSGLAANSSQRGGSVLAIDSSSFFGITAGGFFQSAGLATANNIANWAYFYPSPSWFNLPDGTNEAVSAVLYLNFTLYIGGNFTSPASYMSKWEGSKWNPIAGGQPNHEVFSILEGPSPFLYVGGAFTDLGGDNGDFIARYDYVHNTWGPLGSGFNDRVRALTVGNGELYAGGSFTASGTAATSRVAGYSGGQWRPLGSGVDGQVYALAFDGQSLYVGGSFLNAGGKPSTHFGRYGLNRSYLPVLAR